MRFVSIWRPTQLVHPTPQDFEVMGKFINEALAAGVLLATEGFGASTAADLRMRREGSKVTITDGPFAEAKELIGGFALMQVKSRAEMIEWTKRFLAIAGDGTAEIHQLGDMSPIEMVGGR